jgi:DNA repair protein RadC
MPDVSINSSAECVECFRAFWEPESMHLQEYVYIIYLNRKKEPIFYKLLNIGNFKCVEPDLKTLFYYALNKFASYIIIAHNHTNGTVEPSKSDILITNNLVLVCEAMDITLMDHLILNESEYYSFSDNGLI